MDSNKNIIAAISLSAAIIVLWALFFSPSPEEREKIKQKRVNTSTRVQVQITIKYASTISRMTHKTSQMAGMIIQMKLV